MSYNIGQLEIHCLPIQITVMTCNANSKPKFKSVPLNTFNDLKGVKGLQLVHINCQS